MSGEGVFRNSALLPVVAVVCLTSAGQAEAANLSVISVSFEVTADREDRLEFYAYSAGLLSGAPGDLTSVLMTSCPWVSHPVDYPGRFPPYCGMGHYYYGNLTENQRFYCDHVNYTVRGTVGKPPCSSGEFGIYNSQGEIRGNCRFLANCTIGPAKFGQDQSAWCQEDVGGEPKQPAIPDSGTECTDCEGSPIVLDLDRNGFQFTGVIDLVEFDIDADGLLERLTWTGRNAADAFLALDRNSNGVVDDGSELFGNNTVLLNGALAAHGYIALAELDGAVLGGDGDGKITAGDGECGSLLLWTDSNHTGSRRQVSW